MKRVYIAESLVDCQLIADWLKGNGVPCELFNQNAVGALGELPVSYPEVWIRRELDIDKAEHLIKQRLTESDGADKVCRQCDEISPFGFDICWNCRQPFGQV